MIQIAKTNGVVRLPKAKNVVGGKLAVCCTSPMTGFFRDGCCNTGPEDVGSHTVCIEVTAEFLAFSKSVGNDLSTPNLQWGFPGLQPGDRWCLCAPRWQEALDAGYAPMVVFERDARGGAGVLRTGRSQGTRGGWVECWRSIAQFACDRRCMQIGTIR